MLMKIKNISLIFAFYLCIQPSVVSMEWTEELLKERISSLQKEIRTKEQGVNQLPPIQRPGEREQIKSMKINLSDLEVQLQKFSVPITGGSLLESKHEQKELPKESNILYKIGDVEVNEEFLRTVAIAIFKREQQMEDIKDKMCTHGQKMCDAWKLGQQWGQLDATIKEELKKTIKPNDIQSLLKRHDCALLDPNIIANPEQFLDMITKEHIELSKTPDRQTYAIIVKKDFTPRILGTYYTREVLKGEDGLPIKDTWHKIIKKGEDGLPIIKELKSTRLFISFDIQDIADKIIIHGINSWNPNTDGRLTTICIDEK